MKCFSLLILLVPFIVSGILFIACKNEYSFEGGNLTGTATGTSVYMLSGAGGNCANNIVNGNYYAGKSLASNNTVQLEVNVTTIGTYNLSTSLEDNIRFSASGNFTNTGIQTILLTGIGTPSTTGVFMFTTPVGLGCSFTIGVKQAPAAIANYTLTGAPNNCQNVVVSGGYIAGKPLNSANYVTLNINVTAVGAYSLSTDTLEGITFSKSGTFTQLGNQTIMLPGLGTPVTPRNLVFTPAAGNSQCTFNLAVVNPDPLAVYVLESGYGTNSNPCIYTIAGTYTSHAPLSNTNTVTMQVYDSIPGNFTIATNTVNGIMFSYSGNFATTGVKYVTLIGSGTPLNPGMFILTPQIVGPHPLGGQACSVSVTVQ